MVRLLNSLYLGASTLNSYGNAKDAVELLPLEYYLGSAVPSGGTNYIDVILSGVSPLVLTDAVEDGLNYLKLFGGTELLPETYLDTVTLDGGCEQNSTPTPTTPVDIVCNNGTIKVSPNLFNKDNRERIYGFFPSTGSSWTYNNQAYSNRIPCLPNTTYTARYNGNSEQAVLGFGSTDSDNVPTNGANIPVTNSVRQTSPTIETPITITTGANDKWLIVAYTVAEPQNTDMANNLQVQVGSTATPYMSYGQIYTDGTTEVVTDSLGNTANAERLLAVGDYKDTQEVLSGSVTRNVGVKVLDGTESWNYYSVTQGALFRISISDSVSSTKDNLGVLCNCFRVTGSTDRTSGTLTGSAQNYDFIYDACDTSDKWKQWLKDQYNAGQPVVIVYPLDTATTETVSGQFLSKSPVTQTAGSISNLSIAITESSHTTPTPQQPLQINCNNGVLGIDSQGNITVTGTTETVEVTGKNLLNKNLNTIGKGISSTGVEVGISNTYGHTAFMQVLPNTTYTFSGLGSITGALSKRGAEYSNNDFSSFVKSIEISNTTFTTSATTKFVCLNVVTDEAQQMLELGSTATTYEPYYNGGTATAENLFKIDTYQDVQSVIDGGVTRNVGVKVLDGTEDWFISSLYISNMYNLLVTDLYAENTIVTTNRKTPYCTHFQRSTNWLPTDSRKNVIQAMKAGTQNVIGLGYGTVSAENLPAFKSWLADQYNAGTPVIVAYPLATATTESVTAQPLSIQQGTNIVTITQASIDNLTMEISYKATS